MFLVPAFLTTRAEGPARCTTTVFLVDTHCPLVPDLPAIFTGGEPFSKGACPGIPSAYCLLPAHAPIPPLLLLTPGDSLLHVLRQRQWGTPDVLCLFSTPMQAAQNDARGSLAQPLCVGREMGFQLANYASLLFIENQPFSCYSQYSMMESHIQVFI